MKRKLIIVAIFIGLGAAAILVVLATRQDAASAATEHPLRVSPDGQIVIVPPQPRMTVVASLPRSNANASASPATGGRTN